MIIISSRITHDDISSKIIRDYISSRITHDDISSKLYVIIYVAEVYTVRFVFLPEEEAGLIELRKKWPTTDLVRSDLTLSPAATAATHKHKTLLTTWGENERQSASSWVLTFRQNERQSASSWVLTFRQKERQSGSSWMLTFRQKERQSGSSWVLTFREKERQSDRSWMLTFRRRIPVLHLHRVGLVNTCVTLVSCGVGKYLCHTCTVWGW